MGDTIITNAPLMFYDSYCISVYTVQLYSMCFCEYLHMLYVYKYLYSTYSTVRDKKILHFNIEYIFYPPTVNNKVYSACVYSIAKNIQHVYCTSDNKDQSIVRSKSRLGRFCTFSRIF